MDAVEKLIQHVELQIHWQDLCDKASTQRKVWLADIARLENEVTHLRAVLDSAPPYTAEELDIITNPRFSEESVPTPRALDFAICAPEYHASLDEQGDRFCRMCGQPLSQ